MVSLTFLNFSNNFLNFFYTFTYINVYVYIFIFIFYYSVYCISFTSSFRHKILYFYLLLFLFSGWGFFFSLESFVFLILLAELLIILLFILMYITSTVFLTIKNNFNLYHYGIISVAIFLFFCITHSDVLLIKNYVVYNSLGKLVSDDFFFFFFFLFFEFSFIIYLIALILTFFSIFFILFYFSYKFILFKSSQFTKNTFILRKQHLNHQIKFTTSYRSFQ